MLDENLKYQKASSLEDVFKYRKQGFLPFAGGTDVMIKAKEGFLRADGLLYIGDLKELKGIYEKDGSIFIGAAEKVSDIAQNPLVLKYFPALSQAILTIGSPQIRNLATLGGNMSNCSPVADSMPMLMSLNAKAHILSENGIRIVEVSDFPKGVCQTVLDTGEIIKEIQIPVLTEKNKQFYRKFAQRKEVAIQKCSLGAVVIFNNDNSVKEARFTIGAVAVRALRCHKAEEFIKNKKLEKDVVEKTAELISEEAKPITDLRSNVEYRKKMVGAAFIEGIFNE
ncbi:MAG: xanthine dehydrogenase family protein subunit M [Candidatus Muiribacteriota bacterium]